MEGLIEYKDFVGSVKDVDVKGRVITGYLSSFDNVDHDNDIFAKGAYTKSINERKDNIYFLNQHNWQQPHGGFDVLEEQQKGLYFESSPFVKGVSYSDDVLKLYEAGVIKEHSVGFVNVKSEMDAKSGVRIIKEVKLFEGSNVTLGANSNTPFTGFKAKTLKEVEDQSKLIYKAFRNGDFTDETFTLLEYALKQLQREAYELGKISLTETKKPLDDTSIVVKPIDSKLILTTLKDFRI
jgi:HK97 family phage prohead protease